MEGIIYRYCKMGRVPGGREGEMVGGREGGRGDTSVNRATKGIQTPTPSPPYLYFKAAFENNENSM